MLTDTQMVLEGEVTLIASHSDSIWIPYTRVLGNRYQPAPHTNPSHSNDNDCTRTYYDIADLPCRCAPRCPGLHSGRTVCDYICERVSRCDWTVVKNAGRWTERETRNTFKADGEPAECTEGESTGCPEGEPVGSSAMARMQSMQSQCCCCAISVFSALFGIIMLSTGVCLVLNYRIMEVDTTGLPPEWRNEEGKKIVGIILICCGIGGMGMSALITVLYFTVCSRPKTTPAVAPAGPVKGHGPGHLTAGKTTHHPPHTPDPYSTEVNAKQHNGSKGRRGKRTTKKRPHLKKYKNNLTTHKEVINESEPRREHIDLDESSQSLDSSQTASSRTTVSGTAQEIIETSLKTKQESAPPVILNVNSLPQLPNPETGMLKTMPPPPIPSESVEIDSEEEEVSQIEEIKKLDKQVAGLIE